VLQQGYTTAAHAVSAKDLVVLGVWAAVGTGFAAWRFRWS
jgi:hypothetical protein